MFPLSPFPTRLRRPAFVPTREFPNEVLRMRFSIEYYPALRTVSTTHCDTHILSVTRILATHSHPPTHSILSIALLPRIGPMPIGLSIWLPPSHDDALPSVRLTGADGLSGCCSALDENAILSTLSAATIDSVFVDTRNSNQMLLSYASHQLRSRLAK